MINFLKEYFQKLLRNEFVKNVLTLVSGTSVAQLIPILVSPILTRIYEPEDFAIIGVYMSVAAILSEIVTGKFELAIMNADNEKEQTNLITLTLLVIFMSSALFFVLFTLFFDKIPFLNVEGNQYWKYLLIVSILILGINKLLVYLNIKRKSYKRIAYSKVSKSFTLSMFQLGLYFLKYLGLIIGYFISLIIETIVLIKENVKYFKKLSFKGLTKVLKRYKKFPLFEVPSSLFNIGTIQAPIMLIPNYFGPVYGGFYFQAYKILTMPISLIGGAIGQVFFEQGSIIKDDDDLFSDLVFSTHKKLFYLSIIPIAVLSIFGDDIFSFVFGTKWRAGGEYAMIMTPWIFFNFLTSPISTIIIIKEKQNIGFIFVFFMSFFRLIGLLLGVFYFKDLYITIILFSGVSAISYVTYASFLVYRFLTFGLWRYWFLIFKYGIPVYLFLFMLRYIIKQ
jgi:O-antigen/teichoic acid export membrane protein